MKMFAFLRLLMIGVLLSFQTLQTNVDAALGSDCSTDPTICDTPNNEVCSGTTCDCDDGYFEGGSLCASVSLLKPTDISSPSQTETSVSLYWTSPDANGYTNTYIINYSAQGGSAVQTHNVIGQNQFTTVPNLSPGTTYTFTVVRFINKDGRTKEIPSDQMQATTSTAKGYGESCTTGGTDECGTGLDCASTFNKCLCADGFYYAGTTCTSNFALKPVYLQSNTKSFNNVTLSWTSPDAAGYTNSYYIFFNYENGAPQTHNVNGQNTSTTVRDLSSGITYTFIVVRSITREGRTQTVPASDSFPVTTDGVYSDSCKSLSNCGPYLVCAIAVKGSRCLCQFGNYFTGSICTSTEAIKPTTLTSSSQTHTEVYLSWTSLVATGYINSYVIRYNSSQAAYYTYNVVGQSTAATVPNLSPGTTYTFTVAKSITRFGRSQTLPASNSTSAKTKLDYGYSCDVQASECRVDLACIQENCICVNGQYYVDGSCLSTTALRPLIVNTQPTSPSSVTINWNSPPATGYINSYVIKYTELGTTDVQTSPVSGGISTHLVTGLKPGTSYIFIVARSITREGRTQTVIDSVGYAGASEKINYGEACVSKGTCKNLNTDCYSSTCRCVPGYFWEYTACRTNDKLIPGNVDTETLSTTQLRVTWTASIYPGIVTGYLVELSPPVPSENILITGTSATISSLTPGERYRVTVSSKSSYLDRGETAAAGAVFAVTRSDHEAVVGLTVSNVTSRGASLTWKRPVNTKGVLYKYGIEVFNSSTCVQRINIECTVCKDSMNIIDSFEVSCESETDTEITQSNINNENFEVHYDLSLLPYTVYEVSVAAYNEEEKGPTSTETVPTQQEVPGNPTEFRYMSKTSDSVELRWNPPEPRPGVTSYEISVYEWDQNSTQYQSFKNISIHGFYKVSINTTGLSSNWKYTFEIYARTSKGVSTTVYGPEVTTEESASERPGIQVNRETETEESVELLICPPCILDNTNGVITKSGILVCVKGDCPIRDDNEVKTADSYDKSPNWDTTAGVDFTTWYRATEDDWLKGKEASDEIRFVLGGESCGVEDQNRFCNGPLQVDRTYRVWIFTCTRNACIEGDHVEFTLANAINDNSMPIWIIATIVAAVVFAVLAAVILVIYIKVIRPRSQRQRSTPYVTDTSDTPPNDDTYEDIGNRRSVVKDGRSEEDYYNTTDNPPRSYDQLKVYSNQGHHDYGQIRVTQT